MIDRLYRSAIADLIKVGFVVIFRYLAKYLEHKSDVFREIHKPFIESSMKAYENLTEALKDQPENAEEILKELRDLREMILQYIIMYIITTSQRF